LGVEDGTEEGAKRYSMGSREMGGWAVLGALGLKKLDHRARL
jgi:hypothetical protein